jgi:hypothetical protein
MEILKTIYIEPYRQNNESNIYKKSEEMIGFG